MFIWKACTLTDTLQRLLYVLSLFPVPQTAGAASQAIWGVSTHGHRYAEEERHSFPSHYISYILMLCMSLSCDIWKRNGKCALLHKIFLYLVTWSYHRELASRRYIYIYRPSSNESPSYRPAVNSPY